MKVVATSSLCPPGSGTARFEGVVHGMDVSFFVVNASTGNGADTHIHPYPEVFIILGGDVAVTAGDERRTVGAGHIVIIPANTWHAFRTVSDQPARMVNIHPNKTMIQEWA